MRYSVLLLVLVCSAAFAANIFYRPLEGTKGTVLWYLTDEHSVECQAGTPWHNIRMSPNPAKVDLGCWRFSPEGKTFEFHRPGDKHEQRVPLDDFRPVPPTPHRGAERGAED